MSMSKCPQGLQSGKPAPAGIARGPNRVFVALLAVVILGSIGLAVYLLLFKQDSRGAKADPIVHFQCTACGRQFPLKTSEILLADQDKRAPGPPQANCPFCRGEQSAQMMVQCRECKEYFLPRVMTDKERRTYGEYVPMTCPKCGATQ